MLAYSDASHILVAFTALAVPKIKAPVSATPGACYSRPVHPKPIWPKTAYDRMGVRSVKSVRAAAGSGELSPTPITGFVII